MKTKFDGKPRMVNSFQIQELHCLQSLDSHYESAVLTSDLRASTLRSREFSLFASARFNTNPKRSSGFSGSGTFLGPSIPIATSSALCPRPCLCVDGSRVCAANESETRAGKRAAPFATYYQTNGAWHVRYSVDGKQSRASWPTTRTNIARSLVSVH